MISLKILTAAILVCVHAITDVYAYAITDVYVQLFEWSWADIEKECVEFLGPKGYKAVQISPPVEHIIANGTQEGSWWERYQPVSYKLESRSGTELQLKSMMQTCKKAGVEIYVDAVFNHMAYNSGKGYAGTPYDGYLKRYAMWRAEDFHHLPNDTLKNCRIVFEEWANNTATNGDAPREVLWNCNLCDLPDLNSEDSHVQNQIAEHLVYLLDLGAGGFRIDAAKHQSPKSLAKIFEKVKANRTFPKNVMLELFSSESQPVKPSDYLEVGQPEFFEYARIVSNTIGDATMNTLRDVDAKFPYPSDRVAVFLDNHDSQRDGLVGSLTYKNGSLYTLANVFMLAWPYGHPKVMSSFYFDLPHADFGPPFTPVHDGNETNCGDGKTWVCEHRRPAIANMVAWRRVAGNTMVSQWQEEGGERIAFARGSAFVALNRKNKTWSVKLQTGMPAGTYCNIAESDSPDSCPHVSIDTEGFVYLTVPEIAVVAFHGEAKASNASTALGSEHLGMLIPRGPLCLVVVSLLFIIVLIQIAWQRSRKNHGMSEPLLCIA